MAALLAAALLSLGGCGDDDPPPPPPSSSTPTSPSPTTSSPTSQAESAEEFIRRWVDEDIKMQNSGETVEFLAMTSKCGPCSKLAQAVNRFYAAGGYVKTQGWEILSVERLPATAAGTRLMLVRVDGHPTEYRESSDGPVRRLPGGRTQFQFTLIKSEQSWLVRDYVEVSS
ncbi:MAG: hypothetical protein U0R80_18815 [Nocardioidaceae bacterium]